MQTFTYRGEKANLEVLAEEIVADPALGENCSVQLGAAEAPGQGALGYGAWAEIVIAIASGVATNAIYDSLRILVDRARDRGKVEEVDPGDGGTGGPGSGDDPKNA